MLRDIGTLDDMDVRESRAREVLQRRVEAANVFPSLEEAARRISNEQGLVFYLGIDPTGPDIHLGHTIPLLLLGDLAALGHKATLLIGDFTARIGDPTGKEAARKALTQEEVAANMATYIEQVKKILPETDFEVRYNSEWLSSLTMEQVLRLTSAVTVQQMMAREMFQERTRQEKPIYVSEFLYPLMQGYDSVALRTDGEVGGNDQTFNMLVGRDLEKELLGKDKLVVATRLLVDAASGKKMSKSEGSLIAISDTPAEIRRKVLALDDSMTRVVFELCTRKDQEWIRAQTGDPRAFKEELAGELIRMYHGEAAVAEASKAVEFDLAGRPYDAGLMVTGATGTMSASHRLIDGGGLEIDGKKVEAKDWKNVFQPGQKVRVGKGKFIKVK